MVDTGGRVTRIAFEGIERPIEFLDSSERLLDLLSNIVHGWPWRTSEGRGADAIVTVRHRNGRYRIDSPWLDKPVCETDKLRAAGNLAVDLIEAYLHDHLELLCLHCGAAEINGRLVVFPAHSRAGKSTLMARLAANGTTIFTDDALPIRGSMDDRGWSFGIATRLRLPLPESASERFRRFVDANAILVDDAYAYLTPSPETRPAFGRGAPLGAVVLLDRQSSGDTALIPVSKGDGLQELIRQNLAIGVTTPELVERTRWLTERLPCYRLYYADLEEAAELIDHAFADWEQLPSGAALPAVESTMPPIGQSAARARHGASYRRNPSVRLHRVETELFLVHPGTDAIYRLNLIAAGLWHLLAEPVSIEEATEVLQGAFPELAASRITDDVARLFSELAARELIDCR